MSVWPVASQTRTPLGKAIIVDDHAPQARQSRETASPRQALPRSSGEHSRRRRSSSSHGRVRRMSVPARGRSPLPAGRSSAAANCCRHRYRRLVLTPARRATSDALASSSFNAKTQRIFSARVQYRRFSFDVMISTAVITPVLCLRTEPVSAINRRRERRSPSEAYALTGESDSVAT